MTSLLSAAFQGRGEGDAVLFSLASSERKYRNAQRHESRGLNWALESMSLSIGRPNTGIGFLEIWLLSLTC